MLTGPDFEQKQILVVFLNREEKITFRNDNIVILDSEGKIKHQSTCYRLFILFVVGHITLTSGLLQRSEKFGFTIVFMTFNFRVYGSWSNKGGGNVLLRKKQYEYSKLDIAQRIIQNKIYNQVKILKSIRDKDDGLKDAVVKLESYLKRLPDETLELNDILGIEGAASRIYFQNIFADFNWTARRPRVKHDITNCLLDIGYTLLFNFVESILTVYGFDVYCGVYHRQFYQRKSLVCDLVEPFRPIIDYNIRKAHNLGQIKVKDFQINQRQFSLQGKEASSYIVWLMNSLIENKQEIFYYIQGYYRAFMKEKEISQYPFFDNWQ